MYERANFSLRTSTFIYTYSLLYFTLASHITLPIELTCATFTLTHGELAKPDEKTSAQVRQCSPDW